LKAFTPRIVCACVALALFGCGSSSNEEEPTPKQAATEAPPSPQEQAASDVCAARADIQTQVDTLSTVGTGDVTRNDLTSALAAIGTNLEKIKAAQPNLTPERKQQVQDATTAFGTQLEDIVRQTVAGLATTDAKAQAETAAASLKSAVTESLQPIDC